MTKTKYIPAHELFRGMSFKLFKTNCIVHHVRTKELGRMLIGFTMATDAHKYINYWVVPRDFIFEVETKVRKRNSVDSNIHGV